MALGYIVAVEPFFRRRCVQTGAEVPTLAWIEASELTAAGLSRLEELKVVGECVAYIQELEKIEAANRNAIERAKRLLDALRFRTRSD